MGVGVSTTVLDDEKEETALVAVRYDRRRNGVLVSIGVTS